MSEIDMPTDPASRWEWIKYQLRIRGTSMAELARRLKVTDRAIRNAKSTPYPRIERSLAKALSLNPADIWPERWNPDGTPHRQRPTRAEENTYTVNESTDFCLDPFKKDCMLRRQFPTSTGKNTPYGKDTGLSPVEHCKAVRSV